MTTPPDADPSDGDGRVDPRVVRTRHDVLSATLRLLVEEDAAAVTHGNLARIAGYSKATIYKHWPTRNDLIGDALTQIGEVQHHTPVGDLRTDLIDEISVYRDEMERHQLDRALVVLVQMIETMPQLVAVRDHLVRSGERVLRELLAPHLAGPDLEAAILMLFGAVLQSQLLRGTPSRDSDIASSVDLLMHHFRLGGHSPC